MNELAISRIIRLENRKPNGAFFRRNAHLIGRKSQKLGNTCNATNTILSKEELLKVVLPTIIGISPTSDKWDERVRLYFNNFTKTIPSSGIDLEVGLEYSSEKDKTISEKRYIELKEWLNNSLTATKDLVSYEKQKSEYTIYKEYSSRLFDYTTNNIKYGKPINKENYLIYTYCIISSQVANREEDVNKAPYIKFYFSDLEAKKLKISNNFKTATEAEKLYFDIMNDKLKVDSLLSVLNENIYTFKSFEDKQIRLKELVTSNPSNFIKLANDKRLNDKSFIEQCITVGILKRTPNTTIITDTDNNVIGENINDAILILNDSKKVAIKNELVNKLKAIKV